MDKLIKDDLIDEKKDYRDNIKRYLRDMDELLNFWTTKSSRLTLIDCIFRTFAKLHGLQISRTNKTTYTEWRFMNSKHSVFVTEVFHDDLFRNTSKWIKSIIRSMADIENYLDLPHWEEEFPEEEHKRYTDDGKPYYYWEFNYRPFKECVAVTQPAPESKPEPKKVYLTTRNPYMSRDWKRFFDEQIKANPHLKYFDTDVMSLYPAYFVPVRGSAKMHPIIKEMMKRELNKVYGGDIMKIHSPSKAAHYGYNRSVCFIDEETFKEKEESMYDWMAHSCKEIMADMGTILHRRQITEKDFKSKEWVWVISEDIWRRLTEKPEFITNCYSAALPKKIYCIDVCVTNLKTNYIKLVKKEKENAMKSLFNTKNGMLELGGVRYPVQVNNHTMYAGNHYIEVFVTGKGTSDYRVVPRDLGYFSNMEPKGLPRIENVIFNKPATIVFWADGTKTVVKAQNEGFDPEKGLAMAITKKAMGNKGRYFEEIKKWLPEKEEPKTQSITINIPKLDSKGLAKTVDNLKRLGQAAKLEADK